MLGHIISSYLQLNILANGLFWWKILNCFTLHAFIITFTSNINILVRIDHIFVLVYFCMFPYLLASLFLYFLPGKYVHSIVTENSASMLLRNKKKTNFVLTLTL